MGDLTGYDWFIILFAIPGTAAIIIGMLCVAGLIVRDVLERRR